MKTKFIITAESEHRLCNEIQMELLAQIRNAINKISSSYPELKFVVHKEVTMEDLKEDEERKNVMNCLYFDEAQGRNKCVNKKVTSNICEGICKYYWNKKNLTS